MFSDESVNIYTDSQYVAHAIMPLETTAYIPSISSIHEYLLQVQGLIWSRSHNLYVGHIRAHTQLPGPLSEGNQRADAITRMAVTLVCSAFDKATQLHQRYHLNAGSLRYHTGITREQAIQIVKSCPICVEFFTCSSFGS